MGSRTRLKKSMGLAKPIEPMLTAPLGNGRLDLDCLRLITAHLHIHVFSFLIISLDPDQNLYTHQYKHIFMLLVQMPKILLNK